MIQRIRDWWQFRHIEVTDVDLGLAGDRAFICASARRRFKPAIELEFDRDELEVLGEMIRDETNDGGKPPGGK